VASSSIQPSHRLSGSEGLRVVAALSVALMLFTALYAGGHSWPSPFSVPFGFLGVDLFLVICGFVILMTLERSVGAREFAWARALPVLRGNVQHFCLGWLTVSGACLALGSHAPEKLMFLFEPRYAPLLVIGMMINRARSGNQNWLSGAIMLFALVQVAVASAIDLPIGGVYYAALIAAAGRLLLTVSRWPSGGRSLAPLR